MSYAALKKWRAQNREKTRRHDRVYAQLKRGKYRRAWLDLLSAIGGYCLACGTTEGVCADHVVPVGMGGGNSPINLQPLCNRCNHGKLRRKTDYRSPTLLSLAKAVAERHGIDEPAAPHPADPVKPPRGCSESGCDAKHYGRGKCQKHYMRDHRRSAA